LLLLTFVRPYISATVRTCKRNFALIIENHVYTDWSSVKLCFTRTHQEMR